MVVVVLLGSGPIAGHHLNSSPLRPDPAPTAPGHGRRQTVETAVLPGHPPAVLPGHPPAVLLRWPRDGPLDSKRSGNRYHGRRPQHLAGPSDQLDAPTPHPAPTGRLAARVVRVLTASGTPSTPASSPGEPASGPSRPGPSCSSSSSGGISGGTRTPRSLTSTGSTITSLWSSVVRVSSSGSSGVSRK